MLLQKPSKLTTKELNRYKKLLHRVKKSDNLHTMRSLITSYIDRGYPYPRYSTQPTNRTSTNTRNSCVFEEDTSWCYGQHQIQAGATWGLGCGDVNGDGFLDILDIVYLLNGILDAPGSEITDCIVDGVLDELCTCYPGYGIYLNGDIDGDGSWNILDVVILVNMILNEEEDIYGCTDPNAENYNPEATIDDGSCQQSHYIPDVYEDGELIDRVYDYQYQDHSGNNYELDQPNPNFIPFEITKDVEYTGDEPPVVIEENDESLLPSGIEVNRVVITAPHSQQQYRPTRWFSSYDPESGSDYCLGSGATAEYQPGCGRNEGENCYKSPDTCTGAMAKLLGEMTGATVIYAKFKQQDPNYYDYLGYDYYSRSVAENDVNSDNQMYNMGYQGLQTPGLEPQWNAQAPPDFIPFKNTLGNYLSSHPEIKLVIDLHGASATSNHWDVDLGLLTYSDNGSNGIACDQPEEAGGSGCNSIIQNDVVIGPRQTAFTQDANWINTNCPDGSCQEYSPDTPPTLDRDFLNTMVNTYYQNEIGWCKYICEGLSNCEYNGDCTDTDGNQMGVTGHGPININDWEASKQHSVTRFVNKFFGMSGVEALQVETSAFYRCFNDDTPEQKQHVLKYMRAMQQIIGKAQYHYTGGEDIQRSSGVDTMGNYYEVSSGYDYNLALQMGKVKKNNDNVKHKRDRIKYKNLVVGGPIPNEEKK